MKTLADVTDQTRLMQLLEEMRKGDGIRTVDEEEMASCLSQRVKGQDHVIRDLVPMIRRAWARRNRDRPIACVAFCGPTGTGKTELAKAMTEYLFRNEEQMIRVDGQNMQDASAVESLIGHAGVYRGSRPGILTQPMIGNDRRLILFDEIDKAHPSIWDLFLTLMGEGKLTDRNTNKQISFINTVIVVTMNAEFEALLELESQHDDPDELSNSVKQHLVTTRVVPRPELAGRIDHVAVFRELPIEVIAEIAVIKMQKAVSGYDLELEYVDPGILYDALMRARKISAFGVRELDRIIIRTVADACIDAQAAGHRNVRLELSDDTEGGIRVVPVITPAAG